MTRESRRRRSDESVLVWNGRPRHRLSRHRIPSFGIAARPRLLRHRAPARRPTSRARGFDVLHHRGPFPLVRRSSWPSSFSRVCRPPEECDSPAPNPFGDTFIGTSTGTDSSIPAAADDDDDDDQDDDGDGGLDDEASDAANVVVFSTVDDGEF
mmetsp:Transcript_1025/g.2131  ORF Transcript_1025/g.2131 Transcript_1025/m.2131 type:complete len:154 (+) Transcript_1025:38-499(+)